MKKTLIILTAVLLAGSCAQATLQPVLYYGQTATGGAIDTGYGGEGSVFTMDFSQGLAVNQVVDLSVTLNVTGGYNGDMYAYLIAPNGTLMLLMDGASGLTGSGMNLTLVNPDPAGRAAQGVDPTFNGALSSPSGGIGSAANGGDNISGTYAGLYTFPVGQVGGPVFGTQLDPTGVHSIGTWGLFLQESGDATSNPQLVDWTLNLAVVPEPVPLALGMFAAMLLALAGVRHFWRPVPKAEAKLEG